MVVYIPQVFMLLILHLIEAKEVPSVLRVIKSRYFATSEFNHLDDFKVKVSFFKRNLENLQQYDLGS